MLLKGATGQNGQIADQAVRQLTRERQLAVTLELLDRGLRIRTDHAGRLELAIAEFGERALDRGNAPCGDNQIADGIALCRMNRPRGRGAAGAMACFTGSAGFSVTRGSASGGRTRGNGAGVGASAAGNADTAAVLNNGDG